MTRPTVHAGECWVELPSELHDSSDIRCTCHLACRQRIFDLERRVAELEAELESAADEARVASELAEVAAANEAEG